MLAGLGLHAGCASDRGVATRSAIDVAMQEAVQSPAQTGSPFAVNPPPRPAPQPAEERFDVNVMDADARDFFMGLVAGTSRNLIVHPDVTGRVTLTLKQITLSEVLDTVRDVYGYDYRRNSGTYIVLPAALQTRVFEIDYLNLSRGGTSRTRVSSGQVTQTSGDRQANVMSSDGSVVSSGADQGRDSQSTGSVIDTVSNSDFWADLQGALGAIMGGGEGRQVVLNAQSGLVFARGMPEELRAVGEYLERIQYPGLIDVRRMRRAYAREMVEDQSHGCFSWRFTMVLDGRRLVFFGVATPHSNSTRIVCAGASALDVARDAYRWFRSALLDHYVLPSSSARAADDAASANVIPPGA
jgi:hypothetical protein